MLVVKADVQGSAEAVRDSVQVLQTPGVLLPFDLNFCVTPHSLLAGATMISRYL